MVKTRSAAQAAQRRLVSQEPLQERPRRPWSCVITPESTSAPAPSCAGPDVAIEFEGGVLPGRGKRGDRSGFDSNGEPVHFTALRVTLGQGPREPEKEPQPQPMEFGADVPLEQLDLLLGHKNSATKKREDKPSGGGRASSGKNARIPAQAQERAGHWFEKPGKVAKALGRRAGSADKVQLTFEGGTLLYSAVVGRTLAGEPIRILANLLLDFYRMGAKGAGDSPDKDGDGDVTMADADAQTFETLRTKVEEKFAKTDAVEVAEELRVEFGANVSVVVAFDGLYRQSVKCKDDMEKQRLAFEKAGRGAIGRAEGGRLNNGHDCRALVKAALENRFVPVGLWRLLCDALAHALGAESVFYEAEADNAAMLLPADAVSILYSADSDLGFVPGHVVVRPVQHKKGKKGKKGKGKFLVFNSSAAVLELLCGKTASPELRKQLKEKLQTATPAELVSVRNFVLWGRLVFGNTDLRGHLGNLVPRRSIAEFYAALWRRGVAPALKTIFEEFSTDDLFPAGLKAVRGMPKTKLTRDLLAALQEDGMETAFNEALSWVFCTATSQTLFCAPVYQREVDDMQKELKRCEDGRKAKREGCEPPAGGKRTRVSLGPKKVAFVELTVEAVFEQLQELRLVVQRALGAADDVACGSVTVKSGQPLILRLQQIRGEHSFLNTAAQMLEECSLPGISTSSFPKAHAIEIAEQLVSQVQHEHAQPFPGLAADDSQRRDVSRRQLDQLVDVVAKGLMDARGLVFKVEELFNAVERSSDSKLGEQRVLDLSGEVGKTYEELMCDKQMLTRKWWSAMKRAGLFCRELGLSAQAKLAMSRFAEDYQQFLYTLEEVNIALERANVVVKKGPVGVARQALAALAPVRDDRLELLAGLHSAKRATGGALDVASYILAADADERENMVELQRDLFSKLKDPTRRAFEEVVKQLQLLQESLADKPETVPEPFLLSIRKLFLFFQLSDFGVAEQEIKAALALVPEPAAEGDKSKSKKQKKDEKKKREKDEPEPGCKDKPDKAKKNPRLRVQDTEQALLSAPGALAGPDPTFVSPDAKARVTSSVSSTCLVERTFSAPIRSIVPAEHAAALHTHIKARQHHHFVQFEAEVLVPLRRLEGKLDVFARVDLLVAQGLNLDRDGARGVVAALLQRLTGAEVAHAAHPQSVEHGAAFAPLAGVTDEEHGELLKIAAEAVKNDFGRMSTSGTSEIENFFLTSRTGGNEKRLLVWPALYANTRECILRKLLARLETIAFVLGVELVSDKLEGNSLSAQVQRRLRRRLTRQVHTCVYGSRKIFDELADDNEDNEDALVEDLVSDDNEEVGGDDNDDDAPEAQADEDNEVLEQESAGALSLKEALDAADEMVTQLVAQIDEAAVRLFERLVPPRASRLSRGAKRPAAGDQPSSEGVGAMATKGRIHALVPIVAVLGVIAAQVTRRAGSQRGALCLPVFQEERLAIRVDVGSGIQSGITQPDDPAARRAVLFLRALAPDGARVRRVGERAVGERSRSVHANRNLLWSTAKVCRIRTRYSNPECEWTVPQMVAVMMGGRNVHDFYHPLSDKARVPSVDELNNAMNAFVQRGRRHEKGQPSFASRKPASEKALVAAVQRTLALGEQGVELQRTIVQRAVIVGIDDNVSGCVLGFFDCRTGRFWCVSVPAGLQREAGGEAEYRALSREVQRNHDDANADEILREIAVALRGRSKAAAASFANMVADFVRQISVMDKSDGAQARIPIVAWGDAHAGGTGKVGGHGTTGLGKSFVEALVARMPVFTVSEMRSSVCCAVTGTRMTQTAKWSRKARGDKSEVDRDRNAALNMCRRTVALLCGVGPPGHLRRAGACPAPRTGP